MLTQHRNVEAPEEIGGLDGLRVVRAMGRLRSMKETMRRNPRRVVREYRQMWEEELDANGRPWSWRDVGRRITWGRMLSMKRVWTMFAEVMRLMDLKDYDMAHAQMVQNMKCIHQLSSDGQWKVAWSLTFLPDPIENKRSGATEAELEAALGYIRCVEDLKARTARASGDKTLQEDAVDDVEAERPLKPKPKGKAKAKNTGE